MKKISFTKRLKNSFEKWKSLGIVAQIVLVVMFLFFLSQAIFQVYPFLWVINNSLKSFDDLSNSSINITSTWEFINYLRVFNDFKVLGSVNYFQMLGNSVWQTFLYLFVNLTASMLIAYALAKFRFPGRGILYAIMIFTQTIPIIGTGGAAYKLRVDLQMLNNPWTIWWGWAIGFDYSAFIMYGTFQGISNSYAESAEIDGANQFRIMFEVIMPQIIPCILALLVTNFVGRWNDYTTAQIYLTKYPTLGYGLYLYQIGSNYSEYGKTIYYAAMVITAIPGVFMYACFQKLIINNMSVGGIKG